MYHLNQHEMANRVLSILSDEYCRSTLLCFRETSEDVISISDLATVIAPTEEMDQTVVKLHHSTLPRLADAGLVEYDSRSETVRYHGGPDVEELLDAVTDCFPREEEFCEVGP